MVNKSELVQASPDETVKPQSAQELEQLRALLFGKQGTHLRSALSGQTRSMVSDVVSEAIRDRHQKDTSIKTTLTPLVEDAVQRSVTSHGEKLTSILYPLVGSLVRKSVSAFFAQFVERSNDVIERALSIKGLIWRYQAWRSGMPFPQFLAAQIYEYRVEQVLLIHPETGLLISSAALDPNADENGDLLSSMLTAIGDFVSDSFKDREQLQELGEVKTNDLSLLIFRGPQALLVAAVSGTAPSTVRNHFTETLEDVHRLFAQELQQYKGDNMPFGQVEPMLQECLLSQIKDKHDKSNKKPWFGYIFVGLLLALLGWLVFSHYQASVVHRKLEKLDQQPGIVVTRLQRSGSVFEVSALIDEAAPSISTWLEQNAIPPERVTVSTQPFISLEQPIVLAKLRALLASIPAIEIVLQQPLTIKGNLDWQALNAFNRQYYAIPGIDKLAIDRSQIALVDIGLQADQQPAIQRQLFEQLVGEIARIQIGFEINDAQLDAAGLDNVRVLAKAFKSTLTLAEKLNLSANLIIIGASDTSGVSFTNKQLSLKRANAVKTALINQGVDVARLFSVGIGEVTVATDSVATRRVMFNVMYAQIGKE